MKIMEMDKNLDVKNGFTEKKVDFKKNLLFSTTALSKFRSQHVVVAPFIFIF